jgi:D-alanyl-D-alanine carboxypeptidase/D-alanyl-D-alanine-endopeptidase (penicillin-binding protein 4)
MNDILNKISANKLMPKKEFNATKLLWCAFIVLFISCSPSKRIEKSIKKISSATNHHTGFVLYDQEQKKLLISFNGSKYFTPASNTKIVTLYAGLKMLGDSLPALRYKITNDSLIFAGTGDPSFLNENTYNNPRAFSFLKNFPGKLYLVNKNLQSDIYGSGWAWDDYDAYYQSERSALPIFGNSIRINIDSSKFSIIPQLFNDSIKFAEKNSGGFSRAREANFFYVTKVSTNVPRHIPFKTSFNLTRKLLADTLEREIQILSETDHRLNNILYSVPADSIYKTMMQVSDNFIAEQILLMASLRLRDTMHTDIAINHMQKEYFGDLPQPIVWVDGSGLSRYNQFTPESIVKIWEKILQERPKESLFPLLAVSGTTGSISDVFTDRPGLIHGKTGFLKNNYSLSGFIHTRRGRTFIFSSMNANFTLPTRSIRKHVEHVLNQIYEHY